MNIVEKRQPPSDIAVICTEGFTPLVLSSFLPLALKEAYPKSKVHLFASSDAAQHIHCFHFDSVRSFGSNCAQNTAQLLFQTKLKKISLIIDLDESIPKYYNFNKDILALRNLELQNISDPEKYLLILQNLNIKPEKLNFKLKVKADIFNQIRHELLDNDFNLKNIFIASPEGEGFSHKSWKSFDSVVKPWLKNNGRTIVIAGENTWEETLKLKNEFPEQVYIWKKHRSFEETVSLISQAKHFVGADSVWTHVATQLGVPTTALVGPTRAPRPEFQKLRENLKIFKAEIPCSPCQKIPNSFDFSCGDNVCMKSHSPEQVKSRVYLP